LLAWRKSPLKRESPHEMGVKEIEVPDGTEIGLNLEASALFKGAEGTGNERR